MAAHTKIDLYQMQSLPLDAKIRMTARRIDAFIDRNDAYLSMPSTSLLILQWYTLSTPSSNRSPLEFM